ncbi:MAG: biopolymer transporter ExbD [Proteobacteria bacterium]|nr:biopolymer transporter ExbD [Pseudomonadota bacterium]
MHIKRFNEINVVPLIDVFLVLLVVILLTSSFVVHRVLEVALPAATQGEVSKTNDKRVVLVLDAEGKTYWHDEPVSLAEINGRLSALPSDTPIDIRIDKACAFENVVAVIDLLKALQMLSFAIHTKTAS